MLMHVSDCADTLRVHVGDTVEVQRGHVVAVDNQPVRPLPFDVAMRVETAEISGTFVGFAATFVGFETPYKPSDHYRDREVAGRWSRNGVAKVGPKRPHPPVPGAWARRLEEIRHERGLEP